MSQKFTNNILVSKYMIISLLIVSFIILTFVVTSFIIYSINTANTVKVYTSSSFNDTPIVIKKPVPETELKTTKITLEEKYKPVFDIQTTFGDFGVEQIYFLNEQCEKYDIPMEIMLSIIYTESSFRSTAKSSTSTASGYCQIIKGTAEWIYEDLLKYGDYDIENHTKIMTTDWKLNIEMSCRYMYCLYWNADQSWDRAIQNYHNSKDTTFAYLNTVNKNMNMLFGITTVDIK